MADALSQFSEHLSSTIAAASRAVVAVHGRGRIPPSGSSGSRPGRRGGGDRGARHRPRAHAARRTPCRSDTGRARRRHRHRGAAVRRGSASGVPADRIRSAARPSCRCRRAVPWRRPRCAGIVSLAGGPWHSSHGGRIDAELRFDIRLAMTAEGGAIVTAGGELVGMAVHGPRGRVLAIPAATISRVVPIIGIGAMWRADISASLCSRSPSPPATASSAAAPPWW